MRFHRLAAALLLASPLALASACATAADAAQSEAPRAPVGATGQAVLVDVRTQPEWVFVGVPAVERLVRLSWQVFPTMQVNGNFVAEIEQMGLSRDTEILCICRSGARSASAASVLTQAGYSNAWNVAEGFEGDKDAAGHRGTLGGWKAAGLPWVQS
jgi:rhodanese-related sulfurtransferase